MAYAKVPDPMSLTSLPVASPAEGATFELLAGGKVAYDRILSRIEQARHSILVRCFEWRDDDAGRSIARALLAAAERGVQVSILKDRIGGYYEHLEATKQSFFHKKINLHARVQLFFLMTFYGRWGSLRQSPSELSAALLAHPKVTFVTEKRFDHAKLYQFDDETVILGGMGIGDDFRDVNVDFMVEITGGDAAERLADRYEGRTRFDASRSFDYLLHSFRGAARTGESLSAQRLDLLAGARERLTIAMAYLGDPDRDRCALRRGQTRRLGDAADRCAGQRGRRPEPGGLRRAPAPHRQPGQPASGPAPEHGARQGDRRRRRVGRPRLHELHPALARRLRRGRRLLPRSHLRPARRAGDRSGAAGRHAGDASRWPTAACAC